MTSPAGNVADKAQSALLTALSHRILQFQWHAPNKDAPHLKPKCLEKLINSDLHLLQRQSVDPSLTQYRVLASRGGANFWSRTQGHSSATCGHSLYLECSFSVYVCIYIYVYMCVYIQSLWQSEPLDSFWDSKEFLFYLNRVIPCPRQRLGFHL